MNQRVSRCILIIISSIFKLFGFWFLGLGLGLKYGYNTKRIYQSGSDTFVRGVKLVLALGSVLLIVSMFGNYGAVRMRRCPLKMFTFLATILIGAEVVIGVLVQIFGAEIVNFNSFLSDVYEHTKDRTTAITLTTITTMLHCCDQSSHNDSCSGYSQDSDMPTCPMTSAKNLSIFIGTGVLLYTALVCSVILLLHIKKTQQNTKAEARRPVSTPPVQGIYYMRIERHFTISV